MQTIAQTPVPPHQPVPKAGCIQDKKLFIGLNSNNSFQPFQDETIPATGQVVGQAESLNACKCNVITPVFTISAHFRVHC